MSRDASIIIVYVITGFVVPGILLFKIVTQTGSLSGWDWFYIVVNSYLIFSAVVLLLMIVATEKFLKDSEKEI